jgi:uncharacterized protein (TIGR02597 family)
LLAIASLFTFSSLSAVETDPVGYITTTTPSGDDSLIGLPLTQAISFTGVTASAVGAEATVSSTLVVDAYNNTHYALATSGVNAGQWSEIIDTNANSIETAQVLLAADDTFDVVPFWTLSTAFPGGQGIGAAADPFNPATTVSVNNLNSAGINLSSGGTYFYFSQVLAPLLGGIKLDRSR